MPFTLPTFNEITTTTTTTDITVRLLLESTIEPLIDSKQKNPRIIHIKHQEIKLENLNPEFLQQCVVSLSRLVAEIQMSRPNQTLQALNKIQEEGTLNIPARSSEPTTSEDQGIKIVQDRLVALLQEEDEDDYGISKPTSYAFSTAWKVVLDASEFMGNSFPKASASTDDEGGIRLTWTRLKPEVEVRLVCPSRPDKQMYLYHELAEKYGVVDDVSALTLASWLQWFNKA